MTQNKKPLGDVSSSKSKSSPEKKSSKKKSKKSSSKVPKSKSNKKTKILAIGDIHGDTGLVKKLVEKTKKENIDFVIIAGDLTFAEISTKNLIGPFIKENKKVLLIPGNHESNATIDTLSEIYSGTRNIHGSYYISEGFGIFGAGGGDVINITPDKEIFSLLEKSHNKIKNNKGKKIMVTHMHPFGSKAEFSGFPGSKAIRKALKEFKPDILITAHIHEASGIEEILENAKVINVSRKPRVFEI